MSAVGELPSHRHNVNVFKVQDGYGTDIPAACGLFQDKSWNASKLPNQNIWFTGYTNYVGSTSKHNQIPVYFSAYFYKRTK